MLPSLSLGWWGRLVWCSWRPSGCRPPSAPLSPPLGYWHTAEHSHHQKILKLNVVDWRQKKEKERNTTCTTTNNKDGQENYMQGHHLLACLTWAAGGNAPPSRGSGRWSKPHVAPNTGKKNTNMETYYLTSTRLRHAQDVAIFRLFPRKWGFKDTDLVVMLQ